MSFHRKSKMRIIDTNFLLLEILLENFFLNLYMNQIKYVCILQYKSKDLLFCASVILSNDS